MHTRVCLCLLDPLRTSVIHNQFTTRDLYFCLPAASLVVVGQFLVFYFFSTDVYIAKHKVYTNRSSAWMEEKKVGGDRERKKRELPENTSTESEILWSSTSKDREPPEGRGQTLCRARLTLC